MIRRKKPAEVASRAPVELGLPGHNMTLPPPPPKPPTPAPPPPELDRLTRRLADLERAFVILEREVGALQQERLGDRPNPFAEWDERHSYRDDPGYRFIPT